MLTKYQGVGTGYMVDACTYSGLCYERNISKANVCGNEVWWFTAFIVRRSRPNLCPGEMLLYLSRLPVANSILRNGLGNRVLQSWHT